MYLGIIFKQQAIATNHMDSPDLLWNNRINYVVIKENSKIAQWVSSQKFKKI